MAKKFNAVKNNIWRLVANQDPPQQRYSHSYSIVLTMQYQKTLVAILIFSAFFLFQGFFTTKEDPIALLKIQLASGIEQLDLSISAYQQAANDLDRSAGALAKLRTLHQDTRIAYKQIEFLLEYIDPYAVKKSFMGAPLPYVEPNVPEVVELQPVGFQVLDELVYEDQAFETKQEIIALLKQLRTDFDKSAPQWQATPLTHRHVFEAARRNLIRIFTLGVTGFDTPGSSANALPEASAAYEGIQRAIRAYLTELEGKDRGLAILADARLGYTSEFLKKAHDFDTFDRLYFLKEHINPLYEILYRIHRKLGIETVYEVEKLPQPINYHAINLFDSTFLNAGYFANINLEQPLTKQRMELGRMLFFDPVLSDDLKTSCGTCHQPSKAFTDGLAKSVTNKGTVKRNAPTLLNCVYTEHFFHDLREPQLERQVLHVVKDAHEFNTDYLTIIKRLQQSPSYMQLFKTAYPEAGADAITSYSVANALAVYVAGLRSFDSPFDQYVTGKSGILDPAAARGFNLFMGKAACGTCHFAPVFNGTVPPMYIESESEVIGVPLNPNAQKLEIDPDEGRYANLKPRDHASFFQYSFKTPTVRNIALTAPYMHNGAYTTLEAVVDFYNKGGGKGMGIDLPHQTLPFDNLALSDQEQKDLVAFMKALTDSNTVYTAPDTLPTFPQKTEWNSRYQAEKYR